MRIQQISTPRNPGQTNVVAGEGRPWKTVDDVELATSSWVHWHNHDRLHGYLGDVSPAEFEQSQRSESDRPTLVEIQ